jgi:hypothetical protein
LREERLALVLASEVYIIYLNNFIIDRRKWTIMDWLRIWRDTD